MTYLIMQEIQNKNKFPNKNLIELMKNKKKGKYLFSNGILSSASFFYNNLQKLLENKSLPCSTIIWHSTKKCNLRCIHCGVNGGDYIGGEITSEDIIKKISDFKKLGVKYFLITGGEATLKEGLLDLIKELKKNSIKVGMSTNLLAFHEEIYNNVDTLQVSLDGFENEHNYIRNSKFSYKLTTSNLKKLDKVNTEIITISTVVYPENLEYLEEFVKYNFHNYPINSVSLKPIFNYGRAIGNKKLFLDIQDFKRLLEITKKLILEGYDVFLSDENGYLKEYDTEIKMVNAFDSSGWNSFYIMENGDIKGSDQEEFEVEGNLLKDDLVEVWYSKFKSYRNRELISDKCKNCQYYEKCGGGYLPTIYKGKECKIDFL